MPNATHMQVIMDRVLRMVNHIHTIFESREYMFVLPKSISNKVRKFGYTSHVIMDNGIPCITPAISI